MSEILCLSVLGMKEKDFHLRCLREMDPHGGEWCVQEQRTDVVCWKVAGGFRKAVGI